MNNEKIYLTQEGYENFLQKIKDKKQEVNDLARQNGDAIRNNPGNGWHDNYEAEHATREIFKAQKELQKLNADIRRIEIIKNNEKCGKKINFDIVEVNDCVKLSMTYLNGETEEDWYRLIGDSAPDLSADIKAITLNSPIGKVIYHQAIGEKLSFTSPGGKVYLEIKEKYDKTYDISKISGSQKRI